MPPVISSVSGSIAEGSTAVVAGSGFGTRTRPAPIVFETFAGGRKNSDALMNNASGGEMIYTETSTTRPRRSHSARADYTKKSGSEGQWTYFRYWEDAAHHWFLSYWIYLPETWHWGTDAYPGSDDALANIKFLRWFPRGTNYTNIDSVLHGFDNYNIKRAYESATGNDEDYIDLPGGDLRTYFPLGKWINVRTEYGENSGLDARDGTFRIWIDGVKIFDDRAVMTNKSGDPDGAKDKAPYVIGFYDSWSPVSGVSSMPCFYADVIVDDTWARVELGDAATYDACTRVEVQPATAWSASSVTFTVNAGATPDGGQAWLYVTDASGARNATGVPVTIGEGGGEIVPPPDGGDGGAEDSTISIVQGPTVGDEPGASLQVMTFDAEAAAGRTIVVIVNAYAGGGVFSSVTTSDTAPNTYTKIVERRLNVDGGESYLGAFTAPVAAPTDRVEVRLAGTGSRGCTAIAYELDGIAGTLPVVDSDLATGNSATPATPALTVSGDTLTFAAVQTYGSGAAISPGAGFTDSLTAEAPAGCGSDFSIITKATTTETSVAPAWSRAKSCQWQAIAFALAAAGGEVVPPEPVEPIAPDEVAFSIDVAEGVRRIKVSITFEPES